MMFAEMLQQVTELLQRQERISYRALKTAFDLDDESIKELQAELIQVRQLASDEDGMALVWRPTASPLAQTDLSAVEPRPLQAERRQLTILCAAFIAAPALSKHLPADTGQTILHAYRVAAKEVINRFGGYATWHDGHTLRVYFGYPQAHEDDAQRAVRTGLGLLEARKRLHTQQDKHMHLAIRIGIHTELAVVGSPLQDPGREPTVAGEALPTATQLCAWATQNTVVISAATYRLVQEYFVCHDLGQHRLKVATDPIQVYRVLSKNRVRNRLDIPTSSGLTPLVGRQHEVRVLAERWQRARQGIRQVVVLSGEAGIGKSRLVHVMQERMAQEPHIRWECRPIPHYQNSAFYPIIDVLERALQWAPDDSSAAKLAKLETVFARYHLDPQETVPLLATLLSFTLPEERYPRLTLPPQRQRQKILEALLTLVKKLTEQQPTLLMVEDLQWLDPSTLEFLTMLIAQGSPSRLLLLLTCRPDFTPPWPPQDHVTYLPLQRLSPPHVKKMMARIASGKRLPAEIVDYLVTKTDGVPLFVEELTKTVLETGLLQEQEDSYELMGLLPRSTIPTTLQGSLMARLDQSAAVRAVAQLGASIGRTFTYELLRDVAPFEATTLEQGLQQLVAAEILFQQGEPPHVTYTFKHALIQDVAYQSLLHSTRQHYHERIAHALEARFPETARTQPELLAHHFTEAGHSAKAIPYWQRAAQQASKRSAHVETIGHVTQGLALITSLLDTQESMRYELSLQLTLGNTLVKMKGYGTPEVGQAYDRARALCQQIGDSQQMARVLYGLWVFYLTRAESATARLGRADPQPGAHTA
jgi:class 3 adenylate cyclase